MHIVCPFQSMKWAHKNIYIWFDLEYLSCPCPIRWMHTRSSIELKNSCYTNVLKTDKNNFLVHVLAVGCIHGARKSIILSYITHMLYPIISRSIPKHGMHTDTVNICIYKGQAFLSMSYKLSVRLYLVPYPQNIHMQTHQIELPN